MSLIAIALLAQIVSPVRQTLPVLAFPEAGLDDSAAYRGYQTRFFHDAARNTVQIYIDRREGRVVHVWADAENESVGFSARGARGLPVTLEWADAGADVSRSERTRTLAYRLTADAPRVDLGWFLLGSMRVERDFQAAARHRARFGGTPFTLPEIDRFLEALGRLPPPVQRQHLALLGAPGLQALRERTHPSITTHRSDSSWQARLIQRSLDGRDTLMLEVQVDPHEVVAQRVGDVVSLRARSGVRVPFSVRIATTGAPLTPLARDEIFTAEFLDFLAAARAAGAAAGGPAAIRARWLERQVRGVELLASREKLMAGLPTYATYFGRDMLVSALMMRAIWRAEMSEFVIASVLRKLSDAGQVSHEEALGGQAVREALAEYVALIESRRAAVRRGDRGAADSLLAHASVVLRDHRRVRENYHMIDDEFQLAVLAARWISDSLVAAERKRAFLLDSSDGGGARLTRLLRELALVARMTAGYAAAPTAANLVSFAPRDSSRWASTSWRDSNAGYAGGRYAMDVNAIWAPHALQAMSRILAEVRALGFSMDSLARDLPDLQAGTPLGTYVDDSLALRRAIDAWRGASAHFLVRLSPAELRSRVAARLDAQPDVERGHWVKVMNATQSDQDSLVFLALALDARAQPIGVASTDPATRLFLGEPNEGNTVAEGPVRADVLRDVRLFVRPYPVGLFIDSVGPVVVNDAYAPPAVWQAFGRDPYHGPRVAWGREVNLFLLGVANRVQAASHATPGATRSDRAVLEYVSELRAAAARVRAAVDASGFHSELWSYAFEGGRPRPVRYGTGADVQLWSTTGLAVQFALSRLTP